MSPTASDPLPGPIDALRAFAAFLRQPRLLQPAGLRDASTRRHWAWMTVLLVAGLAVVLLPLLGAWQRLFDLPSPDAYQGIDPALLAPTVVLAAPVMEELLFRGWQSGRPAALWLAFCAIGAVAVLLGGTRLVAPLAAVAMLAGLLVAGLAGWLILRRRPAPGWFAHAFPAVFFAVAIGFALAHLVNYPGFRIAVLPLVLPQLWAGLVLGYLRQRAGLFPAILAHALSNGCMLALATLAGGQ